MKKILLFIPILVILSLSGLFNSCAKNEDIIIPKTDTNGQIVSQYVLDGINYPVVTQKKEDGTFEVVSSIDKKLAEVLDLPNSTLLIDPFLKKTYYVFRTKDASAIKNAEIINQMNQFENNYGKRNQTNMLKSEGVTGSIIVYLNRYFQDSIRYLSPALISDGGFPNLVPYNDQISSYQVWCNTQGARPDGKRYVIRFFENSNYGGHVLTAYGTFTDWQSGGDYQISWQDDNLHSTLMTGGLFRKYWGDQISSFSWSLE